MLVTAPSEIHPSDALRILTAAVDDLKRELAELERLRAAVAETERAYLDRKPSQPTRLLS
jgi:hypothetical protein